MTCADPSPDTTDVVGIVLIVVIQVSVVEVEVPRIVIIVLRGGPIVTRIQSERWASFYTNVRSLKL